jgi:hypothetical protein
MLFSPSAFRNVFTCEESKDFIRRVVKFRTTTRPLRIRTVLDQLYGELESNYCNEYLFKNSLLNVKLLAEHCLSNTVVLNEFRIRKSIADFVLLNGEIRTFEIKTDLDNFEKLEKQISDYQTFSNRVSVVVSSRSVSRVRGILRDSSVGLIAFTERAGLETVQDAKIDNSRLDHEVLFKSLRKSEYLATLRDLSVEIPRVPNTLLFRECLHLAKSIDVLTFQAAVRETLKKRQLKCPELLISEKTPRFLKHICYSLNPTEQQYGRLFDLLDAVH